MATETRVIEVIIKGTADISGAARETTSALKDIRSAVSNLQGLWSGALLGIGLREIVQYTAQLSRMGAEAIRVEEAFRNWVGPESSVWLEKLRAASRGAISDVDLMIGANRAMMLQVTTDADEMARLLEIAMIRGRAMGISTQFAFDSIITGIGRMSPWILDNIGIVTGGRRAYEDYAEAIGKSADELTAMERRQALINRVLEQTPENIRLTTDAMMQQERLGASWKNFWREVGKDFAEGFSPAIAEAANQINRIARAMSSARTARQSLAEIKREYKDLLDYIESTEKIPIEGPSGEKLQAEVRRQMEPYFRRVRLSQFYAEQVGTQENIDQYVADVRRLQEEMDRVQEEVRRKYWRYSTEAVARAGQLREGMPYISEMYGYEQIAPSTPPEENEELLEARRKYLYDRMTTEEKINRLLWERAQLDVNDPQWYTLSRQLNQELERQTKEIERNKEALSEYYIAQMDAATLAKYYQGLLESENLSTDKRISLLKDLRSAQSRLASQEEQRQNTLFNLILSQADLNTQLAIYRQRLLSLAPGSDEYLGVLEKMLSIQQRLRDQQEQERQRAIESARREREAREAEMASLVGGLLSPTAITEEDWAATRLGIYQDKWDEYVRRLRSAATDAQSAWKHLIPTDILAQGQDAVRLYASQAERLFYAGRFEEIPGAPEGLRQQAIERLVAMAKEEIANRRAKEILKQQVIQALAAEGITSVGAEVSAVLGEPMLGEGYEVGSQFAEGYRQWLQTGEMRSLGYETFQAWGEPWEDASMAAEVAKTLQAGILLEKTGWEQAGVNAWSWFLGSIDTVVKDPVLRARITDSLMALIQQAMGGTP